MTHIIVALFFIAALLGALVAIHLTIRHYWAEIIAALKGEFGLVSRPIGSRPLPASALRQRAAF